MESIKNYDVYTRGMKKSIEDKLFFIDMVRGINSVVDFGCSDGTLLSCIRDKIPQCHLIGIDSDINMLKIAKENISDGEFICSNRIPYSFGPLLNTLLNMSSVIHEVYSYSGKKDIRIFWETVFYSGFKYISIRDLMMCKKSYINVNKEDFEKVISKSNKKQLNDFVEKYGEIKLQSQLVHFLMKYRYVENWDREVQENYFPITVEDLLNIIPTELYKIIYFENYILPFNKYQIQKDFDINLCENEHVKILLERR